MDSLTISKCSLILNQMESKPLFKCISSTEKNSEEFQRIYSNFINNHYQCMETWSNEICNFFQTIIDDKNSDIFLKNSAIYIKDWFIRKTQSHALLSPEEWSSRFNKLHGTLSDLIQKAPAGINIGKPPEDIETITTFSDTRIEKMKNLIENKLEDKDRTCLIKLIATLEPNTDINGDTVSFDVNSFKPNTLLAINEFLKKFEDIKLF